MTDRRFTSCFTERAVPLASGTPCHLRQTDPPQATSHVFSCHQTCKYEMKLNVIPSQQTNFASQDSFCMRFPGTVARVSGSEHTSRRDAHTHCNLHFGFNGLVDRLVFPHRSSRCFSPHGARCGLKPRWRSACLDSFRRHPFCLTINESDG